jgi:hypothetical protein
VKIFTHHDMGVTALDDFICFIESAVHGY